MTALAHTPVRAIVRAIADAAARWSDADFPPRVRLLEAIGERTGYSSPVVEYALDRLFFPLTVPAIESVIVDELGSLDALDHVVERPGRPNATARPVGRVCILSSRTTIGVALIPAIFALAAKCDVLVKDREDGLIRAFFATLHEELDATRDAARARAWDGERDAHDLGAFDAIAAFGDDATLARIRAHLAPHARFVAYGTKASIGYVTREALHTPQSAQAAADGAARDMLLYDTQGCLSLHALFVERNGTIDTASFLALFEAALERANVEFPLGAHDAQSMARRAHARRLALFRGASDTASVDDAHDGWLVLVDPPHEEPPPFLARTVLVRTVTDPPEAAAYLAHHRVPVEAVALASKRPDTLQLATTLGASRITRFGALQSPPLGGYHGGHARIANFVAWMTDET